MFKTILFIIAVLTITIFIHEFGHYAAFKANGLQVAEVSVGIGPSLYNISFGETKFTLRPIVLAGYTRPANMEAHREKSNLAKTIIHLAGIISNFLAAALVLAVVQRVNIFSTISAVFLSCIGYLIALVTSVIPFLKTKPYFTGLIELPTHLKNSFIKEFILISIMLAAFNILPLYPLDGSRVVSDFVYPMLSANAIWWLETVMQVLLLWLFAFGSSSKNGFDPIRYCDD